MFKMFNLLPPVRNAHIKVFLPHISQNYSDSKSINGNGGPPLITRRSKLGAGERLEKMLNNSKDIE